MALTAKRINGILIAENALSIAAALWDGTINTIEEALKKSPIFAAITSPLEL